MNITNNKIVLDTQKLMLALKAHNLPPINSPISEVNLRICQKSTLPTYTAKAWEVNGKVLADIAFPDCLLRKGVTKSEFGNNLVYGIIRACYNARAKWYDKAEVITALTALGLAISTKDNGQRYITGNMPADIYAALPQAPIYMPSKKRANRQVKFECCGNAIYITNTEKRSAVMVAEKITCAICGAPFSQPASTENRKMPAIQASLLNA